MRMCRKRALSFLLTLALIAGCFAGTGVTAEATETAVDKTSITIKLVDQSGNAITDETIYLGVIDAQFPNVENQKFPNNGEYKHKITDSIPTTYTIKIHSSVNGYTADPIELKTNNKKEIVTVNGKEYTGEAVEMEVREAEPEEPTIDKTSITIKLVDQSGNAITDPTIYLGVIDAQFPDKENEKFPNNNGEYKHKITDSIPTTYTIKIHSRVSGYTADPIELKTNNQKEIVTVNGKEYIGEAVEMEVREAEPEEPTIDKTSITIKLVDQSGNAITDPSIYLGVIDAQFPDKENEKFPNNGEYKHKITDSIPTTYTIKLHSRVNGYTADPIELKTNNQKEIVTVNGKEYIGEAVEMEVREAEPEEPTIDKTSITIKLVDQSGNAITDPSIYLGVIDAQFPDKENEKFPNNGEYKHKITDSIPTTYTIKLHSGVSGYTADPIELKTNNQKEIETVNGKEYNGEVVEMEVREAEPEEPTVDKTSIIIKLVDQSGNAITDSSIYLGVVDAQFPNKENAKFPTNGEYKHKITDSIPTTYTIKLHSGVSGYTANPIELTTNNKKEIVTVNGKEYNGEAVEMEVRSSDEGISELKDISLSSDSLASTGGTITVSVTGENLKGNLWYQIRKQIGMVNGKPSYETNAEIKSVLVNSSTNPTFSVTIPANSGTEEVVYQIRVADTYSISMTGAKSKTITVSGTGTSSDKADKTALAAAIEEAEAKNAEEYVTDNNWNTMQEKLNAAKTVNANESATAQEVKTALDELQAALKNLVKKPEKTANITKITATPTEIPAAGGTVQLSVTGTDMTEDNWGLDIKTFISGTNQTQPASDKAGKATVKEITENSAVVEISANGMKNDVDFVISAGSKNGEEITKQAEVTVVQAGKGYTTTSLTPESVVLADDHTVVATFKSVITAVEGADLNKLVYIADADGNNRHDLTDAGKVTIDDQTVAVEYSESLKDIGTTSYLYIKEGALKTAIMESGSEVEKVVADIKWIIQTAARVSGIKVDKDLFDSNGGTVTATLNGYRVEDIELDKIEASIYRPGETSASDIAVTKDKDADGKITLTFAVPKNTTQNTVSYWLNVKYDGTPVYESAADSRGQRTTISVLPEGKTEKDRTLSMVTISGNNKTEVNNTTDIEVQVSSNVGELKTELRVYGTNLDSALTKVRAVDENGIIWPVYQISECDGTWRFIAIAGPHRNGVFGDGNSQLIELLPPRYAGTNKTYKIQVAIDGENFIEEPCVTLKVMNENIKGEYEFRDCTDKNFKYVTVQYVDESGKEIAEKDVYKGYSISMPEGFGIKPKQINGYKLVEEPTLDEWVEEGRTYSYVYKSTNTGTGPVVNQKPPVVSQSIKVSGIKINAASKKIAAGKKIQLSATVSPANASNKAVTWKSSNTKYATVNSSGKVTVKKAGAGKSVTITAIAADGSGKKASCKLQIMKNSVKSVKIKGAKAVKAGKKLKLKAQVKTTGKKVNKKLKWTSSNTKYAIVTSGGVVKTKKAGKGKSVKITAAATDGSNKKSTVKIKIK